MTATQGSGLLRSSSVMAAGTAVSRVLGFVRSLVLIAALGLTAVSADTFDTANKIPNILYMLLAGGVLNAVLVPQIVRAAKADDPAHGEQFVNRLVTLAVVLLTAATVVLTLAAPLLVRLYSSGRTEAWQGLAIAFGYWCIPQVFWYGLYTVLGQVLNAKGRFGAYMWAPALNNLVAIIGLAVFIVVYGPGDGGQHRLETWDSGKIALIGGFATLGVAVQALVLIGPLRRAGFRFRPVWGWRGVGLGSAGRVAMWTFAAAIVGQVGLLVTTNIANYAAGRNEATALESATAGPAAYSQAFLLFMLPHSLVAVSLVTALFTRMSSAAGSRDWAAVRADLSLGLRTVGVFSVLATAGLVALARPVSVAMTGSVVSGTALSRVVTTMAFGLVGFSAGYLLQRVYYAYEDARTPFLVQVPQVVVIVVADLACLLLPAQYMVAGIGAGMSLAFTVSAVLSAVLLRRRFGSVDGGHVLRTHVRLLIIGVLVGAGGLAVVRTLAWEQAGRLPALAECLLVGVLMVACYLAGLRLLRVTELGRFFGRGRLGRLLGGDG